MAFGFGIVGCGLIGSFHAKAIKSVRDAKLVGCCSSSPDSADRFARAHRCIGYSSLKDMLADERVNIVAIAVPSGLHMEIAVAAAKAGKHVIVEKPLEVTLKKCDRIIRECEKSGVKLGTIFPSRFHDSSMKLKHAIDRGRFGRLTIGDAYVKWFRTQEYYDSGAWRGTWSLDGGGALMNQGIHCVDLLIWLMGPVDELTAYTAQLAHEGIEVEDTAVATLRFANGAIGVIEATTAAYPGFLKRIEIHGAEGSAVLEEEDITVWDFVKSAKEDKDILAEMGKLTSTKGGAGNPAAISHHGHAKQFADMLDAIRRNRSPAVDGHQGRRSVEVVQAIYKSAEMGGKVVTLPLKAEPIHRSMTDCTKGNRRAH